MRGESSSFQSGSVNLVGADELTLTGSQTPSTPACSKADSRVANQPRSLWLPLPIKCRPWNSPLTHPPAPGAAPRLILLLSPLGSSRLHVLAMSFRVQLNVPSNQYQTPTLKLSPSTFQGEAEPKRLNNRNLLFSLGLLDICHLLMLRTYGVVQSTYTSSCR